MPPTLSHVAQAVGAAAVNAFRDVYAIQAQARAEWENGWRRHENEPLVTPPPTDPRPGVWGPALAAAAVAARHVVAMFDAELAVTEARAIALVHENRTLSDVLDRYIKRGGAAE